MDSSYHYSQWQINNVNADVLSTATFETRECKKNLAQHQYHCVYRFLWVNKIMMLFSKEPIQNLIYLVELLLGYEDWIWKNSEEEKEYILGMNMFTSCLVGPQTTCEDFVRKGRSMDLLKEVLGFELVDALPTIYWVDEQQWFYLLVGPQNREQIRALFLQLTGHWNQHLQNRATESYLPDLPVHQVSEQTRYLAFRSDLEVNYAPGVVYNVFVGAANMIQQSVASLSAPVEAYLQHLWTKEVHINMTVPEPRRKSHNTLQLLMPRLTCSECARPKEVGILFGLRATVSGKLAPIEGLGLCETFERLARYRSLFGMFQLLPDDLNIRSIACQSREASSEANEAVERMSS